MVDTVIKGTGNSRSIKAAPATLPATYDEFRAQFISSGIPIDLLGLNDAGLNVHGTDLNKASLLKDDTAALFGLGANAVPDDVLKKCAIITGVYTGTLNENASGTQTLTLGGRPKLFITAAPLAYFGVGSMQALKSVYSQSGSAKLISGGEFTDTGVLLKWQLAYITHKYYYCAFI